MPLVTLGASKAECSAGLRLSYHRSLPASFPSPGSNVLEEHVFVVASALDAKCRQRVGKVGLPCPEQLVGRIACPLRRVPYLPNEGEAEQQVCPSQIAPGARPPTVDTAKCEGVCRGGGRRLSLESPQLRGLWIP